ncbi:M48 family metallopeptidase [Stappia sp. MMSF_3263]|uniref:M48 family metallopeptidase n=1 Tax=Stappia sp. MMSF_3263 TaxID=3046693 RepID=UPI00273DA673|nr:SprT family zinc-dependent metalloprotease [Stappia sp. MMSF_3263]
MFGMRAAPLPEAITVALADGEQRIELRRNANARRYILRLPATGGDPVLTVPAKGTLATARDFAERQRDWLAAQLDRRPDAVAFVAGGIVPLRGEQHRIVAAGGLRGLVRIGEQAGEAVLHVPGAPEHLARRLTDWLKREARQDLERAVELHAGALGHRHAGITLRDTRSRWGSCTSDGRLSFSWRLVLAPPFILDYVAAHEVAHLAEMNHGPRFWALCRRLAPRTEEARGWLRREGGRLHLYG